MAKKQAKASSRKKTAKKGKKLASMAAPREVYGLAKI
jgi:hypothetical protein